MRERRSAVVLQRAEQWVDRVGSAAADEVPIGIGRGPHGRGQSVAGVAADQTAGDRERIRRGLADVGGGAVVGVLGDDAVADRDRGRNAVDAAALTEIGVIPRERVLAHRHRVSEGEDGPAIGSAARRRVSGERVNRGSSSASSEARIQWSAIHLMLNRLAPAAQKPALFKYRTTPAVPVASAV